jgi:hypothetical protein
MFVTFTEASGVLDLRGDRVDRGIRGDLARWLYNRGPVVDLDYVGITMRNAIGSEFGLFPVHRLC